ncbi:tyrosine-protein phosphatase [Cellulomonas sp. PhB143]|uniref:tyrosine-protein phosphatase n=1 Tax=Cellulomonas sp. PhB143 TaxID=2485186 RepID=UPI000F46BB84|nr:tyrosine-protein phosphatase [Cellulomonas sp. PhB143]ROS73362.1 protein-tyrosine phosphatase [Cellulomonas sp. PhB143]
MTDLVLDGLSNLRDVGGIPTPRGPVRHGVLLRSDSLASLTAAGRAALASGPVGYVVDMRSRGETEAMPGWPADAPHPRLVPLPMLEGSVQQLTTLPSLESIYRDLLAGAGEGFARTAALVAEGPEAVLVHCTAGKDRTGVATALVLLAVDADRDAVLTDYAASTGNLGGAWRDRMVAGIQRMGVELTPQVEALLVGTDPEGLDRVLGEVEAEHGSVLGYLRAHGLTDAQASALRERLVG